MKVRFRILATFFIVWAVILASRIVYWQVFRSDSLAQAANLQYGQSLEILAPRGRILASDNYPLAQNQEAYLLFAEPKQLNLDSKDRERLEAALAASSEAKTAIDEALNTQLSWYPLVHYISPQTKAAIESLQINGLGFELEPNRNYPEGSPSAYITGFVAKNSSGQSQGYFGLEGFYNRALSGKPGKLLQESDARQRPIVIGGQNTINSQPGQDLITSIDRTVQHIAYSKLSQALEKFQAKSGTVTVMESQTGRILAMVALPGYDPIHLSDYDSELYKNPIVSDAYEPGSTFKVIVMGSALDAGVITPNTICTLCQGPRVISGYPVGSWNDQYYPNSTMSDIILHSDNIGMVFVGQQLGKEKLLSYLKKFGLGKPTGIDLEEEDTPPFRADDEWRDIDLATATFGQGIALTRIQMITAVNTLANGGKLLPPQLVTAIQSGNSQKSIPPPSPIEVISPSAAAQVVAMMKNGVEKGEIRYYRVPGYSVAGKTGTAQVPIKGHYDEEKVIASFIAFAPVENPKFTMLVTLREPQTSRWGSTTAAPLWFDIAKELFRYFKIPPL